MDPTLTSSGIASPGPLGRPGGLRRRLLAAFIVVSVLPVLALALGVSRFLVRGFETRAEARLAEVLLRVSEELETRHTRARTRLASVAEALRREDGSSVGAPPLSELARGSELGVLELVDADGNLAGSHHWPAGIGLPDQDVLFGAGLYRLERVGEGYGVRVRLALFAELDLRLPSREAPLTLRGGDFVDGPFLGRLSALLGVEVALLDEVRGTWIAPEGSPLAGWQPRSAADPTGPHAEYPETHHHASRELAPGLRLVVASPRSQLESALSQVRTATALTALGAIAFSLLVGLWLSRRIAHPVLELAEAARRVSRGEPGPPVPQEGHDEVAQLGRAFNRMTRLLADSRERLLQAERVAAWREMARRLAHELKNPLFPIQLSIETLRRAHDRREAGSGDPEFDELLVQSTETIGQELGALRGIVDEFSQFARMPRPHIAATDVREVVRHVKGLYATAAEGVRLEVEVDTDLPAVAGDRDLLARALGNLVKNALEAMPQGGTLRIGASRLDEAVALSVEDTGPGLDEAQRTRLFTRDYTTKPGGTGLGLAIVQGIVSDHGGRIEVSSHPGSGTRFTILLPIPPAPNAVDEPRAL